MLNLKQRRPMTQAEIDRSIMLQSSRIQRDFNSRLFGKDNEMAIMIDSLIKAKKYASKTPKAKSDTGHSQLKTLAKFVKSTVVEDQSKTAEIGVAATSKDIDLTFSRVGNKNPSGDQITDIMRPVAKNNISKYKIIRRQSKDKNIPQIINQNYKEQIRTKTPRRFIGPKISVNQVPIPKRETNSNKQIILTSFSTRQKKPNTECQIIEPTKPTKAFKNKSKCSVKKHDESHLQFAKQLTAQSQGMNQRSM